MLVRLAPGASYPAHTHAGPEKLHLLDDELWIDGRKLVPGDYNYGAPGARDESVWSETGCTCVLVQHQGRTAMTGSILSQREVSCLSRLYKPRLIRSLSGLCIRFPLQVTIQAGINAFP